MSRIVVEIESIGNICIRDDKLIHLYLMLKGADDITHEIILSEDATTQMLDAVKYLKR